MLTFSKVFLPKDDIQKIFFFIYPAITFKYIIFVQYIRLGLVVKEYDTAVAL
jgi:hypothetical protein